jgi:hypothetical protein
MCRGCKQLLQPMPTGEWLHLLMMCILISLGALWYMHIHGYGQTVFYMWTEHQLTGCACVDVLGSHFSHEVGASPGWMLGCHMCLCVAHGLGHSSLFSAANSMICALVGQIHVAGIRNNQQFMQCSVCAGVSCLGSHFSHEVGASPGWMVRAESADTAGGTAAVKVGKVSGQVCCVYQA